MSEAYVIHRDTLARNVYTAFHVSDLGADKEARGVAFFGSGAKERVEEYVAWKENGSRRGKEPLVRER